MLDEFGKVNLKTFEDSILAAKDCKRSAINPFMVMEILNDDRLQYNWTSQTVTKVVKRKLTRHFVNTDLDKNILIRYLKSRYSL
jgi:hypothetical protein